jgi:Zn-dependent alcohol dehydrogenase
MERPTKTRAIVCHDTLKNDGWKMEEILLRPLQPGELLVEMVATGVCHTDAFVGSLEAGSAPIAFYPRVLGHEGEFTIRVRTGWQTNSFRRPKRLGICPRSWLRR